MICKWCGETLKAGAKTCKRCKREVPALSDCGGFYDLVPQAGAVPPPVPEAEPVAAPAPTPVRPVMPRKKKNNLLPNVIFWLAIALALIFLIQTISLSGKLGDATAEISRLRSQLKSQEAATTPEEPSENINGFGDKEPTTGDLEPTEDYVLKSGRVEITLTGDQNAQLNDGQLRLTVRGEDGSDLVLALTVELHSGAEDAQELYLGITDIQACTIHSIDWRNSSLIEILPGDYVPTEDDPEESRAEINESAMPLSQLGEGAITCTLEGTDENGGLVTIVIKNIVIS